VVATSQDLIMVCSPKSRLQAEIACCPIAQYGWRNGILAGSETTQWFRRRLLVGLRNNMIDLLPLGANG
jgi:hypothetical protein